MMGVLVPVDGILFGFSIHDANFCVYGYLSYLSSGGRPGPVIRIPRELLK